MKRYFELIGEKQTLKLDIEDGSPASRATVKELSKALKSNLKKLTPNEYRVLTALYTK